MQEGTENIFGKQQLPEPEDWHNYLFLAEIDYPRLRICKSSGGWKPLFQKTDFYSSVMELKEFYNKNKDKDGYEWSTYDFS